VNKTMHMLNPPATGPECAESVKPVNPGCSPMCSFNLNPMCGMCYFLPLLHF